MELVGIIGGSGSGKSTVSYLLVDSDPKRFEVMHLDDYQMIGDTGRVPDIAGMKNWEHPDAIDWDRLRHDLATLRDGGEIDVDTWSDRSNPDFPQNGQLLPRHIVPHPIMILEGHLALYGAMADELDMSFYLDIDDETRLERRRQARQWDDEPDGLDYDQTVQIPMHREFVEPTRANADIVIDISDKTAADVAHIILEHLDLRPE